MVMQLSAMVTPVLFFLAFAPITQTPRPTTTRPPTASTSPQKSRSKPPSSSTTADTEASPSLEGWWLPEGHDPHPSQLPAAIRQRMMAATVRLGRSRSGVFTHRDGTIVTSAAAVADCVRTLQAAGQIPRQPAAYIAAYADSAPICPGMTARTIIEIRNVTEAVIAAERAGSRKVQESIVTACNHTAPGRRCELITTEDKQYRLMVQKEMRPVRLRYWPGPVASQLGGPQQSFSLPRLRIDVALLSVDVGHAGAPDHVRIAKNPLSANQPLWVWHHPAQSLRWSSAAIAITFFEDVLPVYLKRTQSLPFTPERQALTIWYNHRTRYLGHIRNRALSILHELRVAKTPESQRLLEAFTQDRHPYRELPWATWAGQARDTHLCPPFLGHLALGSPPLPTSPQVEATASSPTSASMAPPCPHPKRPYALAEARRRDAAIRTGYAPLSPDGHHDLRVSKARVARKEDGKVQQVRWRELADAAQWLNTTLEIPETLPSNSRAILGYVLNADIGPLTTGGPVINRSGELVGIVSGGNQPTLEGLFAYTPQARVAITSVRALRQLLRAVPQTRPLANKLRFGRSGR